MSSERYDASFYLELADGSRRSAACLVPVLRKLLPDLSSAIDFGCGPGLWLSELAGAGTKEILGLDYGTGLNRYLYIPRECLKIVDLEGSFEPIGSYALALSLGVAERLSPESAPAHVRALCQSSDAVLFSSAAPAETHPSSLSARWPGFWRRHFEANGFACFDVLRPIVWADRRIDLRYRQNVMLFVRSSRTDITSRLQGLANWLAAPIVHPDLFTGEVHASREARQAAEKRVAETVRYYEQSRSWRITRPMRLAASRSKKVRALAVSAAGFPRRVLRKLFRRSSR